MKINMNMELNKQALEALYYEYREIIIPIAVIVISIILVFVFLIPQVASFSEKKNERDQEMAKLNDLKKAASLASSANKETLNSNIALASAALPSEKAFEGILNTISIVAGETGVNIDSYQFQGDSFSEGGVKKIPGLGFSIDLSANPTQAMNFIEKLYKTFPLCEVTSIKASDELVTITVNFYYKPFLPVGSEETVAIRELNTGEKQALKTISDWGTVEAPSPQQASPTPF